MRDLWQFNWSPPCAAYMCQLIGSALFQIAIENVVWKMAAIWSQPQCVNLNYVAPYGNTEYSMMWQRWGIYDNLTHWGLRNGQSFAGNIFKYVPFIFYYLFFFQSRFHRSLLLRAKSTLVQATTTHMLLTWPQHVYEGFLKCPWGWINYLIHKLNCKYFRCFKLIVSWLKINEFLKPSCWYLKQYWQKHIWLNKISSIKFTKKHYWRICILKCCLQNGNHFASMC